MEFRTLDVTNGSLETVIFDPKEMLGIYIGTSNFKSKRNSTSKTKVRTRKGKIKM